MSEREHASLAVFGPRPDRRGAVIDILIYLAAAGGVFAVEELLRALELFPYPDLFAGGPTLILSFFLVAWLMKRRGQSWRDLGLKRPRRWWFVPLWGLVVFAVTILAHLTLIPLLGMLLKTPPPDMSRYDLITGNFPLLVVAMIGSMLTGGFIEEFIYRGLMIDRLGRIFGGDRRGLLIAALLNGVPFGLIHFKWGVGGMLSTMVMGSVLGLMYLATKRNLWPLIAAHAALDAILMIQLYYGMLS